ncbi:MAG: glycosyltransferase [Bacilli bacterium]
MILFEQEEYIRSDCKKIYGNISGIQEFQIFIPTFREIFYLEEALDSVFHLDNTYALVISNEWHDEYTEIFEKYPKNRIEVYVNNENVGMANNWNRGYILAKSKWVFMLHDDDILNYEKFNYFIDIIKKNDGIDGLSCPYLSFNDDQLENISTPVKIYKKIFKNKLKRIETFDFLFHLPVQIIGIFLRRECVLNTEGFNSKYVYGADYDYLGRFSYKYNLYSVNSENYLVLYRTTVSMTNISRTKKDAWIEDYFIKKDIEKLINKPLTFYKYHRYMKLFSCCNYLDITPNELLKIVQSDLSIDETEKILCKNYGIIYSDKVVSLYLFLRSFLNFNN